MSHAHPLRAVAARGLPLLVLGVLSLALLRPPAQASIRLSASSFAADALPAIEADDSDIVAAQSRAGAGGYYKLRAKFLVPYDPGYFHGTDAANNNHQTLTGSPGAGSYTVQLYWVAYDSAGVFQDTGPFHSQAVTISPASAPGNGLRAEYFNGANFESLVRTAAAGDVPNYGWGTSGPAGTGVDRFSVRWTGYVEPLFSEVYTFTTGSDDGMQVFVRRMDEPVAGAYWDHGYLEASGDISLEAGQRYEIRVDFFENFGGAEARLFWESPSQQKEIIPLTRLIPAGSPSGPPQAPVVITPPQSQSVNVGDPVYFTVAATGSPFPSFQWRKGQVPIPGATGSSYTLAATQLSDAGSYDVVVANSAGTVTSAAATLTVVGTASPGTGNGLRADYFNGTGFQSLAVSRTDGVVDFDWGGGAPASGVGIDNFSVRWTGEVEAPISGYYTFSTNADDGVVLAVNGSRVIEDWTAHPPIDRVSPPVYLSAGSRVPLTLEFFEAGGGATVRLYWQPPGQARSLIPQSRLYSDPVTPGTGPSGWQNVLTETRFLSFSEDTDADGNGNGNWTTSIEIHPSTIAGSGTARIYTTGAVDTYGWLNRGDGSNAEPWLDDGGEAGNLLLERPITDGSYTLYISGRHQWSEGDSYTVYVDFKPADSAPRITSPLTQTAYRGASFTYQITTTPAASTFQAVGLPSGLTLDRGGRISGTPLVEGTYPITLTATAAGLSDTRVLTLSVVYVPPTVTVQSSASSLDVGGEVSLTINAGSPGGSLRFLNLDQLSPHNGYYGAGGTGTEIPPSGEHYPVVNGFNQSRVVRLTLSTADTYTFRAAVFDNIGWYYSAPIAVTVRSAMVALTVQGGTGSGTFPPGTSVAITANTPPAGFAFTSWTLSAGAGTFANTAAPATSFVVGASSSAVIAANFADIQPPATPTGLNATNVTGTSLTLTWLASADNVSVSTYEVSRNGASAGLVSTNSLAFADLTAGTAYTFAVRARDAAGNWSAWSTLLSVTAGQAPPENDSANLNRLNFHLPLSP